MDETICFCFDYKKSDIVRDFRENGTSTILARVVQEKKWGGCRCTEKNPKGR